MNPHILNIFRGLAARCLKNGLIEVGEVHELSRALAALDMAEKNFESAKMGSVTPLPAVQKEA